MKRKKTGIFLLTAGAVLLLSALLCFFANRAEDRRAGAQAARVFHTLVQTVGDADTLSADVTAVPSVHSPAESECESDASSPEDPAPQDGAEMPTVFLDGNGYAGFLRIPALSLGLPIMSEWSYDRLKIAPCRQFGSAYTNDLVIAAHNYQSHFGRLDELNAGDTVYFTDMNGTTFLYSVEAVLVLPPTEVASVKDSGFDLALYTCTYNGKSRIAVFCSRKST